MNNKFTKTLLFMSIKNINVTKPEADTWQGT